MHQVKTEVRNYGKFTTLEDAKRIEAYIKKLYPTAKTKVNKC